MTARIDDRTAGLVAEAVARPPMVWSPYDGRETKCYTPLPAPGDPEHPFGIVRKIGEHRYQELTGHEDLLTHRGRLVDTLIATAHYRLSQVTGGHIMGYQRQPDLTQAQVLADLERAAKATAPVPAPDR